MTTHKGGCHCGRVRFEVDAAEDLVVCYCNCSICRMSGYLIVREDAFRLQSERAEISTYTFNTGVARHFFCTTCGVKSFYVPRSNPDGISVNVRCLDPGTVRSVTVEDFDGQNWEDNAAALSHLTD